MKELLTKESLREFEVTLLMKELLMKERSCSRSHVHVHSRPRRATHTPQPAPDATPRRHPPPAPTRTRHGPRADPRLGSLVGPRGVRGRRKSEATLLMKELLMKES